MIRMLLKHKERLMFWENPPTGGGLASAFQPREDSLFVSLQQLRNWHPSLSSGDMPFAVHKQVGVVRPEAVESLA